TASTTDCAWKTSGWTSSKTTPVGRSDDLSASRHVSGLQHLTGMSRLARLPAFHYADDPAAKGAAGKQRGQDMATNSKHPETVVLDSGSRRDTAPHTR